MVTHRRSARGFTVVEVLVALTVFALGILGASATAGVALRMVREAAAREAAVSRVAAVLDSLSQVARPTSGEIAEGAYIVRWSVSPAGAASRIEAVVEFSDGTAVRRLGFDALHAPLPYSPVPSP